MRRLGFAILMLCLACFAWADDKKEDKKTPDVPVVVPIKPKNPEVEPAVSDQAVMPLGMVRNRVDNIKISGSSHVGFDAIKIDTKRRCWVLPHALTGSRTKERCIEVKRDAAGYHLLLENIDHQWEAMDLDATTSAGWIPVRTIVVK